MSGGRRLLALGLWGAAALALLLGVATARAVIDGEREIAKSDTAFDDNDLHGSIAHARRAASAYAPYAPHVERGYERLTAIARGAEATGRPDIAALAWQAQRAAALESAGLSQPFPQRLDEANKNLGRLAAAGKLAPGSSGQGPGDAAQAARRVLEESRAKTPRRGGWGGLLPGGLLGVAVGLGLFAGSAVLKDGSLRWSRGRLGLALILAGAACWALAAFRA